MKILSTFLVALFLAPLYGSDPIVDRYDLPVINASRLAPSLPATISRLPGLG